MSENVRYLGIGRQVEEDWMLDFEDCFKANIGNRDANLKLVTRPGVIYADFRGIAANLSSDNPILPVCNSSEEIVDKLIETEVLDQTIARRGITNAFIKGIELSSRPINLQGGSLRFPIIASVYDVNNLSSQDRYQILHEKQVVRNSLGIKGELPNSDRIPRHKIKIGSLACVGDFLGEGFFKAIRIDMDSTIDLTPISQIDDRFRKSTTKH